MAIQPHRPHAGLRAPSRLERFVALALVMSCLLGSGLTIFSAIGQGPPAPPVQPPGQFETGSVTITQANADAWLWVPFTRTFAKPPIVVMGPSTRADTAAAVVTAVDVYTNGFYCQINEWDYLDGVHGAETVQFLALSEGNHNFGGQIWQVGKIPAVNRAAASVTLTGFSGTPVVLTQVSTYNNWTSVDGVEAINTRVSNVTSTGFQVQLSTEDANASLSLADEGVSYIAVSQGTGYLDGKILSAVRTSAATTHSLATVTFPNSRTNPMFVAQTQTINDADPGELRMANLSATSVQLMFQEETSVNSDVTHAAEVVGYIVLGDMAGETAAKIEVGDVIVQQSSATTWTTVNLSHTYTTPIVVMGPLSYTNSTSLTIRVQNVTSTSFQFQVDRWDHHSTQSHNVKEKLSYIVMESGSYAIGGTRWQAGKHTAVTPGGVTQAITSFATAPAVFAQVTTTNDPQAVQARVSNVTTTGFNLELDESEIDSTAHANETVNWIAVTKGTSNFFSTAMRLQAGTVTNVDSAFRTVTFSRMHADPFLFAAMQTKNDTDPATLRWRYLFADKVDLVAQEDNHPAQFGETTVNNTHSAETVAFMSIQGEPDRDGDGAPDAWESSVGLNPDNASDGSLDADSDLLTNQQEYHNRLDFVTSSVYNSFTGGVVTVGNAVTSGYEVNDVTATTPVSTQARFRVYRNGGFAPITVSIGMAGTPTTDTNRAPASSSDYSAWTASSGGTQVSTSISLPANAQSVDIYIRPVIDSLNEYPEGLKLTANTGSTYTLGSTTATVVMIYDSMDIPANEKLFVGPMLPQGSAVTSASGFATLILNGPNNKARISTTFNGLTTPQQEIDGSHVHFVGGTIVYGEPDGLPNGPLVDYPWTIVDSAGYKAQRLIDALFHLNGEYLYVNVHTTRYTSGEIRAELTRASGGPFVVPAAPPALENLASDDEVRRECARFLTQATFGASEADIDALFNTIQTPRTTASNRITAFTNWLNDQWTRDQTSLYDYHKAANDQEWKLWGAQPDLPAVVDDPATTTIDETYPAAPPPDNPLDWTRWGVVPNPSTAWTYRPVPPGKNKESYDPDYQNRRRGWWSIVTQAHDQLRQRVAFALEQIFVVSDREGTVQTRTFGHSRYYDMLADHVDGVRNVYPPNLTAAYSSPPTLATGYTAGSAVTVRDLLEDISKSPIMGKYLSHLQNQKAIYTDTNGSGVLGDTVGGVADEIILSPDENYAREIMQLFSIGLLQLHPDGTLQLDSGGRPIATYDNDDIKELSRVFTGWSFGWVQGSAANGYVPPAVQNSFFGSAGAEYFHPGYENPMKNFPAYHDEGQKLVLGSTLPAYTGSASDTTARTNYAEADLDGALNALFNHPNIGPFLSRLLIQRLVTSNPSRGYVYRVAQVFEDSNGAAAGGVRGSIKDVVKAILLDYEARSLTFVDPQTVNGTTSVNVSYGKVKEPIVRYVQILRAFNARSQIDFDEAGSTNDLVGYGYPSTQLDNLGSLPTSFRYGDTVGNLGQTPNNMPSVFNWYLPDYSPGGRVAAAGLVAPELQIATENMVVNNINYHRSIDYTGIFDPNAALPTGAGVSNLLGDAGGLLDNINVDLSALTAAYKANRDAVGSNNTTAATYLIDRLDALLCSGSLKAKYPYTSGGTDPRSVIIDQLALISPTSTNPLPINNAGARVRAALYLITTTPEFIVQK